MIPSSRQRLVILGLLCAGGVLAAPVRADDRSATVERRLALMGTQLDLTVEAADRATALAASEQAVAALAATEARLSTWRPDSELSRLNRSPVGLPFALSPELGAELATVHDCWLSTSGAFDPTVGPLISAWGLRSQGRVPSRDELRQALEAVGMDRVLALSPREAARRREGVVLEEGGFGKGAGLKAALAALTASGAISAFLDFGGQVAGFRRQPGTPWEPAIADPRRRDRPVVVLSIDHGSLSTSGNSEHGMRVGSVRYGHLLDPRSGRPAPDFGSLTVWADDPLVADCLSTGLYVLGPKAAVRWAETRPGIEVLALLPGQDGWLRAWASRGLRGRLKAVAAGVKIEFR